MLCKIKHASETKTVFKRLLLFPWIVTVFSLQDYKPAPFNSAYYYSEFPGKQMLQTDSFEMSVLQSHGALKLLKCSVCFETLA